MTEQSYSGRVAAIIYQNDDFRIAKVVLDGEATTSVTVTGAFPAQNIVVGSWVSFAAKWVTHRQYGRQLSVTRSPIAIQRWTEERAISALSANGIGPQLRLQLLIHAESRGMSLVEMLDAGDLTGSGLDEMSALFVITRWRALKAHLDAALFLSEAGVPARVIGKVWSTLGDELEEKITEDPWVLVRVAGISFAEADEVARRLNVPLTNPGRLGGAVLTAIQNVAKEGHVYALTGQVISAVNKMIPGADIPPVQIAAAIKLLYAERQVVVDRDKEGTVLLYDPWSYRMELECAEILSRRNLDAGSGLVEEYAKEELDKWAQGHQVTLTETQRLAAHRALTSPISVLTGLPGAGKTTTLRAVVSVLKDANVPFLLVAPTGIAAKRLASVTGTDAATVHRAFGAKGWKKDEERESTYVGIVGMEQEKSEGDTKKQQWGHGPENPHPAQVVIVDESSMVDLHMLYRLLQGTLPTCRLVFVGDPFQLPSVGAGDVLRDLAASDVFPHTHLHEIFRQEGTSGIVVAAHDVHAGRMPDLTHSDFKLIEAYDDKIASLLVMQIAKRLYDKSVNFQVLSPRHAGDAGVTNLNEMLRLAINPPSGSRAERNLAGSVVREGDRIMVVKNDYERGVYNGDVGKVNRINHKTKELVIHVFAEPGQPRQEIRYNLKDGSPPIRLAYAQTIHKSQGQEYDIIVVPMLKSFGWQLQRNLLYTAITRAKQRVLIVGESEAVRKAVKNDRANKRNTHLLRRLWGGQSLALAGTPHVEAS
jgi:exodeoxyribonuclease V alpha subunit